jgi:hypothetical protein
MAWGLDSLTAPDPDGALGSATDTLIILTTRGGDRCRTTATAGIPSMDEELGEEQRQPTFMESGGIMLTLARARPGQIHTPEIMVRRRAVAITIPRPAGVPLPDGATTRMSTPVTRVVIAVPQPTTRIPESSPAAVPDTWGMSTPARGRRDGPDLLTTPTPGPESLAEGIIFTRGKTVAFTATIARAVIGHPTPAAVGSPRRSLMPICNGSNNIARKEHNVPITSTPRAVTEEWAVLARAASEEDSDSRSKARPRPVTSA